ncbi:hypothetical protein PCURB6_26120 [Paenibacillus curdlanolyticus]|nr:hypothetical protein PCURB6_26120 [Paenibacillus curdlanolyticus]
MSILLSIGLVMTACQKETRNYSNDYNSSTDFPYLFHMQGDGIFVTPTENGYYFLNDSLLYYADKNNMQPVLLDNRPENDCLHPSNQGEVRNCFAYVKHDPAFRNNFLGYYNEKLYTLESGEVWEKDAENQFKTMLIEISKDGSTRKVKRVFDAVPKSVAIHRGMLYYSLRSFNKESNGSSQLMQVSLNSSKKPTPIYSGSSDSVIADILPYGKNIYFYELSGLSIRLMRYDIEKQTTTRMFTSDDSHMAKLEGIYNQNLLYNITVNANVPPTVELLKDKQHRTVFASNLEGGDSSELPIQRDFFSFYYVSGDYFYARPVFPYLFMDDLKDQLKDVPHELTVYNKQYEIVDKIDMSFLPIDHSFMIGDDRYMFIQYTKDGKKVMEYLDKTEIGTGKAVFKPLLENPVF